MSSPAISGVDVTLGKTGYNPYRTSQFTNIAAVARRRPQPGRRRRTTSAPSRPASTNPNMVLDLRIPLTKRYEQDVLDTAVSQYLARRARRRRHRAGHRRWLERHHRRGRQGQAARCLRRQPWRPAVAHSTEPEEPVPTDRLSATGPRAERPTRSARGAPTARPDGCSSGPPSSSSSSCRSSRSSPRSRCRSRSSSFHQGGVDLKFIGFANYQQLLFGLERIALPGRPEDAQPARLGDRRRDDRARRRAPGPGPSRERPGRPVRARPAPARRRPPRRLRLAPRPGAAQRRRPARVR